jgi:hypothetical protein
MLRSLPLTRRWWLQRRRACVGMLDRFLPWGHPVLRFLCWLCVREQLLLSLRAVVVCTQHC